MEEERFEENRINKKDVLKYSLIFAGVIDVLPITIGVILMVTLQNYIYLEILCFAFGAIGLLAAIFRSTVRDRRNYKKNKSVFEDKTTPEYRTYRVIQWLMIASAILILILSFIFYLIFKNVYPGV